MKSGILTVRRLKKLLKLVPKNRIDEPVIIYNDGDRYSLIPFIDLSVRDFIEFNVEDTRLGKNCMNYITENCDVVCDGCNVDDEVISSPEKIILSRKEMIGRQDYTNTTYSVKQTRVLVSIHDEDGSLVLKRFENLSHIPRVGEVIILSRPYLNGSSIGGTVSNVSHNYSEDGHCVILLDVKSAFRPKIK